ncbi:hypothetical protein GCM10010329_81770 [Streptomyces spiroverticillatus]|uniref:Uncharacterized protein n=1 Tax=Streptomyces finlayi TaxID=67296 RepID=A0A918X9H3_9ACTN|nr:hypothetical protein [Streptomyces finlayi]GHA46827.1 hypothetical protein GCM10010329_81770 [Streptomyces spiroverticillatus]GHD18250.1 hypothetical protein GCM10010334_80850 [Streptomyces finlayi]
MFQGLIDTGLLNTAKRAAEKERQFTLPQLEKALRALARAATVLRTWSRFRGPAQTEARTCCELRWRRPPRAPP